MAGRRFGRWTLVLLLAAAPSLAGDSSTPSVDPELAQAALSKQSIRRVVLANRTQIRRCYEQVLAKQPTLEGKLVVRFRLGPSGAVGSAAVEQSTVSNAALESCVIKQVATWKFPWVKGCGEATISYPFVFKTAPPTGTAARGAADEGARLLDGAITSEQVGAAAVGALPLVASCGPTGCVPRAEVAKLCGAFAEAGRRLDAGAAYAAVAEPIHTAARAVCCEDVLGMLQAVGNARDADKQTIWCALDEGDGGTPSRCGWPACPAFTDFWPKFRKQPASWFPAR